MGALTNSLEREITSIAKKFLKATEDPSKDIQIISHFDTDGITSATIMIKTLRRLDKKFSLKIIKVLEKEFITTLPKDKITIFLDLASAHLEQIKEKGFEDIFIIDHHEMENNVPEGINIINPELHTKQKISGSSLTYLFCKELDPENKDCAKLAILGMIGDMLEKEIDKLNNGILEEGEIKRKRGLLIYPSTRPLSRTLEFSSRPYIPEVTGNPQGVSELLREIELDPRKSLMELTEEEMEKLITAIVLRNPKTRNNHLVGDIFLIKFFNKLEDARELSAKINACSRLGESETAIQFCMEIVKAKKRAESIHAKYRQFIISGLKFAAETNKIDGKGFTIINAKNNIKDTMIGTIASILSTSPIYKEGTVVIGMAYCGDKIKVSARGVGNNGRNVRQILHNVIGTVGGEIGGHRYAAGCVITQDKEQEFIDSLKKNLEIEVVKI